MDLNTINNYFCVILTKFCTKSEPNRRLKTYKIAKIYYIFKLNSLHFDEILNTRLLGM